MNMNIDNLEKFEQTEQLELRAIEDADMVVLSVYANTLRQLFILHDTENLNSIIFEEVERMLENVLKSCEDYLEENTDIDYLNISAFVEESYERCLLTTSEMQ